MKLHTYLLIVALAAMNAGAEVQPVTNCKLSTAAPVLKDRSGQGHDLAAADNLATYGTYWRTPTMGHMLLPLVHYHGRGAAAATIEPLSEHLDVYDAHFALNFGMGVQSAYRGLRLFDTDVTKAVVKQWVDFYRKYEPVFTSPCLHSLSSIHGLAS